mgnify:CR=1 FL=1
MDKPKKKFYDLDIQSDLSSGESSVEEIIEFAEKLGFKGIAISDYAVKTKDVRNLKEKISEVDTELEVYPGVKIKAGDVKNMKDKIRMFRNKVHVVIVSGGSVEINRAACKDPRVDILAHPEKNRKDSGIDHVIANLASENNVALQINVKQLLEVEGKTRSHVLSHQRRNFELADKYGASLICSSGASSIYEMKGPRELAAFPHIHGMGISEALETVAKVPRNIIQNAEKRNSPDFVGPGVEEE